jgi:single-strand DNA-binding protein
MGKGSLVAIQGSIRIDSYQTQSGETRRATRVNANRVQFLDTRNKSESSYKTNHQGFEPTFEPSFEPTGLDPQGFQAIDDDDIPF